MVRSIIYRVWGGVFALLWLGYSVQAESAGATFGCPAQPNKTCFFVVFLGVGNGFETRNFEVPGGETRRLPDVVVGRDTYCYGINETVASTCKKITVSNGVNK